MYSFPELIKRIRNEANLTQVEFAKVLNVSTILVSMVETGQKEVSKKFLVRLAESLDVHPSSITPFLFTEEGASIDQLSSIERKFVVWGERMQDYLIRDRAHLLRQYAN